MQKQIEQLQSDNATAKANHESEMNQLKVQFAVEKALTGAKAKNIKAVKALLDLDDAKLDKDGNVNKKIIDALEISLGSEYETIIGRQIKFINNDIYYKKGEGYYYINNDYEEMFNDSEINLTIVGIIQEEEDNNSGSFIYYDKMVQDEVRMANKNSQILIDEMNGDDNVLGINIDKEEMVGYLGGSSTPNEIEIYSDNISDKDKIINVLKEYNNSHDKIIYEDVMASNIKIVRDFISIISYNKGNYSYMKKFCEVIGNEKDDNGFF